jgi:hypothetical protein
VSEYDLGVTIAKLDLPNRPAGDVNLAQHDRRASLTAAGRSAGAHIAAVSDLNGNRRGIEVGLEHVLIWALIYLTHQPW